MLSGKKKKKNETEETFIWLPCVRVLVDVYLTVACAALGETHKLHMECLQMILYDLHFKLSDIGILSVHTVK